MIEKVVANWLTSADENSFQLGFVQLLLAEGHDIIFVSKHEHGERGKDVISRDESGKYHAYQLKVVPAGRINIQEWRKFSAEIFEAVDYDIEHPSVPANTDHTGWFVINGELTPEVSASISQLNRQRQMQKYSNGFIRVTFRLLAAVFPSFKDPTRVRELRSQMKGELEQRFLKQFSSILPEEPSNLLEFLKLYTVNGREQLDKGKIFKLIYEVFEREEGAEKSVTKSKRCIARATLLTAYALTPYMRSQNWVAVIDGLTIAIAAILRWASINEHDEKIWRQGVDVLVGEIERINDLLEKEILSRTDFMEPNLLVDGQFYRFRTTELLGHLSAVALLKFIRDCQMPDTQAITHILSKQNALPMMWGEAVVPHFVWLAVVDELSGKIKVGALLETTFEIIVNKNNHFSEDGLPKPYYDVEHIMQTAMGATDDPIDETFEGRSYTLKSLLEMLVRRDKKTMVQKLWRLVSHTGFEEFIPENQSDFFAWHAKRGEERTTFPLPEESWSKLRSMPDRSEELPKLAKEMPWLLPLYSVVVPQRFTPPLVAAVDKKILK